MHNNKMIFRPAVFIASLLMAFVLGTASMAQSLSAEQLEQLKNLSPSQRQAIVEALTNMGTPPPSPGPQATENEGTAAPEVPSDGRAEPSSDGSALGAGDTLVITLDAAERDDVLHDGLRRALGSRLYVLDREGAINFPKVGRVKVAGLRAEDVVVRLQSEPDLAGFMIAARKLSLAQTGASSLQPFGQSLFEGAPSTFAPATDIPVPSDYVIGVGDTIRVQLFGSDNRELNLIVGRDGQIALPNVGPVNVSGMSFDVLREELTTRIEEQAIGVKVAVTMGELRSIRIFVLGDVNRPGSYTVSSLSTMTNALFVSGGLLESGSLRDVQLKRNNRIVSRLDMYELLLRGNTRADARLKPGDVIFVPPVENRVSIFGQVLRPAMYELKTETTVADLIDLAGGLLPSAFRHQAQIVRFNDRGNTDVLTVNLSDADRSDVASGDIVQVLPALASVDNAVVLSGHVHRSGQRQWTPGMRLTDLIPSALALKAQADLKYVLIHRKEGASRLSRLLSANLADALAQRNSAADIELFPLDEVVVFSIGSDRAERIRPYLEKVKEQSRNATPTAIVTISGSVRAPGSYPLEPGARASDLIRAAGGLLESAYTGTAELTRQILIDEGAGRLTVHEEIVLDDIGRDPAADVLLQPYDYMTVREIPNWRGQETVRLSGEVRFPGVYAFRRGEFLSAVIERAGGLTDYAFTEGSVFLREELKEREREQLDRLADRVRREISALPVDNPERRSSAEQLLTQLESSEPQGRLVIELGQLIGSPANESVDILVKNGDHLVVPPRSQEVTVIGEVQYATSHIYTPGLDRRGYILKSGDLTVNADVKRIYVVRANGNVVAASRSAWFARTQNGSEIRPGDTIVVPLDADRISRLSLWTSVTQIVYNIGVAAAAVSSF